MSTRHPWNPWRTLRAIGDHETPGGIVYGTRPLPSGNAWWVPSQRIILMRPGLKQVQRRCALAHELAHVELGHSGQCEYGDADRQGARAELAADEWAAHRLITLSALADVLVWTDDPAEAADELWVTRRLLEVRLEQARRHPGERAFVAKRLREKHDDGQGRDGGGGGAGGAAAGGLLE